ncbi:hypothetical protein JTB14_022407 [Gonioctena quinquepunctata]|nr:hypothetical protein JTB14_022407 [Gonioctena quinquepunctata]
MVTEDRRLSKAYDIIDSISSEPASSRDECSVHREHVANKLRKSNERSRAILINKINSSIFEAEMNCTDISRRNIKLVNESPVARKRRVTANLSWGEIDLFHYELIYF